MSRAAGLAVGFFFPADPVGGTLNMQLRHRRKRNLAKHDWIIITVLYYSRERGRARGNIREEATKYGDHRG